MAYRVSVPQLDAHFETCDDETIVEAATRHGIDFPYACHSGTCGTCKSRLVSGDVTLLDYSRFTLTNHERADGLILACCAIPTSDCEVAPVGSTSPVPSQRLECEVASIEPATHDINILRLATPARAPLQFLAGQFGELTIADLPTRPYSMANRPGEPLLEFHIRLAAGGKVSSLIHDGLAVGDRVRFHGPLGSSYLRDNHAGPILALAGGSGLGPIKSIIDTLVSRKSSMPIHFYFGVREERDLYFATHFQEIEQRFGNFTFTPVLSQPSGTSRQRTGFIADIIERDFQSLTGYKAYLAGPPVMVETSIAVLEKHGLTLADIHADAF